MPANSPSDIWSEIVELHNHTKIICLQAEENDRDFKNYFHPAKEQRDALEHIVRAKAAELGLFPQFKTIEQDTINIHYLSESPADYEIRSLDKALGHEYRAFFDAADWFGVRLREKICHNLKEFSHSCIMAVLPDYYPKISLDIDAICKEIASIRGEKDISRDTIMVNVDRYREALERLIKYNHKIIHAIPALIEWTSKNFHQKRKDNIDKIVIGVVTFIITSILAIIGCKFSSIWNQLSALWHK